VGISGDRGETFEVHDVVISGSNSPHPVDPNPIIDGDKIRLTYLGNFMQGETNKIVTATSSDGINFAEDGVIFTGNVFDPDLFYDEAGGQWVLFLNPGTGLIKATASSPTASFTEEAGFVWSAGSISSTHKIGGKYYTYYAGMGGISVAEYSNGNLSNVAEGIIDFPGLAADPTVAVFGPNDYKMFFKTMTSENQPSPPPENQPIIRLYYIYPTDPSTKVYTSQNIGSAYSVDGVNFVIEPGARLSGAYLSDPDVFEELPGKWVIFYSKAVAPDGSEKFQLFKAKCQSPNGTFIIDNSFVGNYGNISSTVKIGENWYVYAVGSDGITISIYNPFTKQLSYVGVAISGAVADPSVIRLSDNSFKMYYKSRGNTYCADSSDGLSWGDGTLVVSNAEVPGAIYVDGKIYLYYVNSAPDANQGKILVRISSDNGATFSSPQVVAGLAEAACDPDPVPYTS
jgi:hypothetical protein